MPEDHPRNNEKRRFIAGAVCPQCRALDRLVVTRVDDQTQQRECVACGFSDQTRFDVTAAIPRGKVERKTTLVNETTAQNVRLIDPNSDGDA